MIPPRFINILRIFRTLYNRTRTLSSREWSVRISLAADHRLNKVLINFHGTSCRLPSTNASDKCKCRSETEISGDGWVETGLGGGEGTKRRDRDPWYSEFIIRNYFGTIGDSGTARKAFLRTQVNASAERSSLKLLKASSRRAIGRWGSPFLDESINRLRAFNFFFFLFGRDLHENEDRTRLEENKMKLKRKEIKEEKERLRAFLLTWKTLCFLRFGVNSGWKTEEGGGGGGRKKKRGQPVVMQSLLSRFSSSITESARLWKAKSEKKKVAESCFRFYFFFSLSFFSFFWKVRKKPRSRKSVLLLLIFIFVF